MSFALRLSAIRALRTQRGKILKQTDCANFPNWSIESEKPVKGSRSCVRSRRRRRRQQQHRRSAFTCDALSTRSLWANKQWEIFPGFVWEIFLVLTAALQLLAFSLPGACGNRRCVGLSAPLRGR